MAPGRIFLIECEPCTKMCILTSVKVHVVLWLARYYRDSIEVILVEFIRTGGDKSFTDLSRVCKRVLQGFKRIKRKRKENKNKEEKKMMKT